jgi:hypothetical protein
MDEADAGVKLRIAGQALFDAWHPDQGLVCVAVQFRGNLRRARVRILLGRREFFRPDFSTEIARCTANIVRSSLVIPLEGRVGFLGARH